MSRVTSIEFLNYKIVEVDGYLHATIMEDGVSVCEVKKTNYIYRLLKWVMS